MAEKIRYHIGTAVVYKPRYCTADYERSEHVAEVIGHDEEGMDFDLNVVHIIKFNDGYTMHVWPNDIVHQKNIR